MGRALLLTWEAYLQVADSGNQYCLARLTLRRASRAGREIEARQALRPYGFSYHFVFCSRRSSVRRLDYPFTLAMSLEVLPV